MAFIESFTALFGVAPSFAEIGEKFRTTPPTVNSMIKTLESRGFLARVPGEARTLRVLVPTSAYVGDRPSGGPGEAVIFVGIQATGKSTFYRERFFRTHVRVNLDQLGTRHREDRLLATCLECEIPFVVDNTNPTAAERAKYITLARSAGFRVVGYYFESRLDPALLRNAQREPDERVPEAGLKGTAAKLERPRLIEEGFDALSYVRIEPGGGFQVDEWCDEV